MSERGLRSRKRRISDGFVCSSRCNVVPSCPPLPPREANQLSNIAFIKTHKTASTTLASILYRYGKRHDSNISRFRERGTVVDLDSAAAQVRYRAHEWYQPPCPLDFIPHAMFQNRQKKRTHDFSILKHHVVPCLRRRRWSHGGLALYGSASGGGWRVREVLVL